MNNFVKNHKMKDIFIKGAFSKSQWLVFNDRIELLRQTQIENEQEHLIKLLTMKNELRLFRNEDALKTWCRQTLKRKKQYVVYQTLNEYFKDYSTTEKKQLISAFIKE